MTEFILSHSVFILIFPHLARILVAALQDFSPYKNFLLPSPELHAQPILTSCTDHNYVRCFIIKFLVIYLPFKLSSPKISTDHIPIHDTYGLGPYIFWTEKYLSHSLQNNACHLHWTSSGLVTSTLTHNTSVTLFQSYARTDSYMQQESSCQR
jgi:hypothetical protein